MSIQADVVIVGAGIVGAACAFELSREKFQVVVVDENGIAMGATAGGMGHIVAMHDSEAQFALTSYSQALWRTVAEDLPSDVEYQQCGTIWIASSDEDLMEAEQKHDYFSERNIPSEILDSHALRLAEPKLRVPLAGGLLVPGDAVLYAPAPRPISCGRLKNLVRRFISVNQSKRSVTERFGSATGVFSAPRRSSMPRGSLLQS